MWIVVIICGQLAQNWQEFGVAEDGITSIFFLIMCWRMAQRVVSYMHSRLCLLCETRSPYCSSYHLHHCQRMPSALGSRLV